jgi:hypothetical protein
MCFCAKFAHKIDSVMQLIIESPDEKVLQAILELVRPCNVTLREVKESKPVSVLEKQKNSARHSPKRTRKLGIMPGLVAYMAPDFNAPIDDFAPYMH